MTFEIILFLTGTPSTKTYFNETLTIGDNLLTAKEDQETGTLVFQTSFLTLEFLVWYSIPNA